MVNMKTQGTTASESPAYTAPFWRQYKASGRMRVTYNGAPARIVRVTGTNVFVRIDGTVYPVHPGDVRPL